MTLENGTLLHLAARSIHHRQAPALPKSISVVLKSLRERLQPHLVSEEGKSAWHHDDSSEKDTRKKKNLWSEHNHGKQAVSTGPSLQRKSSPPWGFPLQQEK